jgi:MOSC domain-containing protein YiiM
MSPIGTLWWSFLAVECSVGVILFGLVPTTTTIHPFFYTLRNDIVVHVHALASNHHHHHHHQQQIGKVVRLAARRFHPQHSKPSSPEYTTRKDECSTLCVQFEGCHGDYNHYRTVALQSTQDRAVSLLTCDVLESLRATYPNAAILEGDLGENILVDGVTFPFFQVGHRYCIDSLKNDDSNENASTGTESGAVGDINQFVTSDESDTTGTTQSQYKQEFWSSSTAAAALSRVVLEITEPIQPCANLCKLPYINDESLTPKERIEKCKIFLRQLDQWDGFRGWYAKVIQPGSILKGATIIRLQNE